MPAEEKKQPIVIKKVKKGGGGHHGGAWKVAYADFVTAMMAFFLLMWLLGSSSEAQRAGISEYFKNPSAVQGPGGASTSMIKLGGARELPQGEEDPLKDSGPETSDEPEMTPEERAREKARLEELMQKIKEQIESSPVLRKYKEQLLIDLTSEGLRIQIVDKKDRPMFDLGSAQLKWYMEDILHEIAKTIGAVPNHVSITGHTDARRYSQERRKYYSNWELSADRANAARRELVAGGVAETKMGRVVGLSDSVLFDKKDPYNPVNRRISIVVLNKATERAIGLDQKEATGGDQPESTPEPAAEPEPGPPQPPEDGAGAAPEQGMEAAIEGVLGPPATEQ